MNVGRWSHHLSCFLSCVHCVSCLFLCNSTLCTLGSILFDINLWFYDFNFCISTINKNKQTIDGRCISTIRREKKGNFAHWHCFELRKLPIGPRISGICHFINTPAVPLLAESIRNISEEIEKWICWTLMHSSESGRRRRKTSKRLSVRVCHKH